MEPRDLYTELLAVLSNEGIVTLHIPHRRPQHAVALVLVRLARLKHWLLAHDTLAVDHWQAGGYSSWTGAGDAHLARGWHPLQVDYFDQEDNARLLVIIGVDGQEFPLELTDHLFHQPE